MTRRFFANLALSLGFHYCFHCSFLYELWLMWICSLCWLIGYIFILMRLWWAPTVDGEKCQWFVLVPLYISWFLSTSWIENHSSLGILWISVILVTNYSGQVTVYLLAKTVFVRSKRGFWYDTLLMDARSFCGKSRFIKLRIFCYENLWNMCRFLWIIMVQLWIFVEFVMAWLLIGYEFSNISGYI